MPTPAPTPPCDGHGYLGGCSPCENGARIRSLTFEFDGAPEIVTGQDSSKYSVTGSVPSSVIEVEFVAFDSDGVEVFSQIMTRGEVVTLAAADFGVAWGIPTWIYLALYDSSEARGMNHYTPVTEFSCDGLLCVMFHGSCSQPVVVNDQFGGIKIAGFVDTNGASDAESCECRPPAPPETCQDTRVADYCSLCEEEPLTQLWMRTSSDYQIRTEQASTEFNVTGSLPDGLQEVQVIVFDGSYNFVRSQISVVDGGLFVVYEEDFASQTFTSEIHLWIFDPEDPMSRHHHHHHQSGGYADTTVDPTAGRPECSALVCISFQM